MTRSTPLSTLSAPPRYATRRNPALATYGPHVARVAAVLGHPSMPWQTQVSDVANEIVEDPATGLWRYRYSIVLVTTPRRAGKTTLLGATKGQRCMSFQDYRCWYTAQSGQDARDTWREWEGTLSRSLPGRWKFRLSNGEETASFPATGSFMRTFPPTPDALHGKNADMPALDEVWALNMKQGGALMQAVVPTMATRPHSQLWVLSTAGDESSIWFRSLIDRGRASLEDPGTDIAYFEWACPDDLDVTDPASWPLFHPAYGHTIDERAMTAALSAMGPDAFARAFGNRWPDMEASWRAGWPQLVDATPIPATARVTLAVDAGVSHRSAAITAAGPLPDGRIGVEVVDHRNGVEWVEDRVRELTRRHRTPILIHTNGPVGYLIDRLKDRGVRVTPVTSGEYANAAGTLRTMIVAGDVAHQDDPRLNRAVAAIATRTSGDREVWKRTDATVDICPLVAASLAVWKASTPGAKPVARGG